MALTPANNTSISETSIHVTDTFQLIAPCSVHDREISLRVQQNIMTDRDGSQLCSQGFIHSCTDPFCRSKVSGVHDCAICAQARLGNLHFQVMSALFPSAAVPTSDITAKTPSFSCRCSLPTLDIRNNWVWDLQWTINAEISKPHATNIPSPQPYSPFFYTSKLLILPSCLLMSLCSFGQ